LDAKADLLLGPAHTLHALRCKRFLLQFRERAGKFRRLVETALPEPPAMQRNRQDHIAFVEQLPASALHPARHPRRQIGPVMKLERNRHALRRSPMQNRGAEPPERRRIGNRLRAHEILPEIMTERYAKHGAIGLFYKAQFRPTLGA